MTIADSGTTTVPDLNSGTVVGADFGHDTVRDADQAAHELRRRLGDRADTVDLLVATHFVIGVGPAHVALSVEAPGVELSDLRRVLAELGDPLNSPGLCLRGRVSGPDVLRAGALDAAIAHTAKSSGRLAVFPGQSTVPTEIALDDLVRATAIDRAAVLSGGDLDPRTTVVTRSHLRPTWTDGELVLAVERAARGTLVPFETPNPTPCCVDHA